jgi:hypothetical protein
MRYAPGRLDTLGAITTEVLLVAGLLDSSCIYRRAMMAGLGGESVEDEPLLPKFDYYLDESDPDILLLRRQDGAFAAAFSAQGATREGLVEAAKEDYWKVIEANAESLGLREEGD